MGTAVEFRKNSEATTSPIATVALTADESFPLVLFPDTKGPLGEIGYEITNVADAGTAVQPLFARPTEPGKLPQGSKPYILINQAMELSGVMFQGEDAPVTAWVADTQ